MFSALPRPRSSLIWRLEDVAMALRGLRQTHAQGYL